MIYSALFMPPFCKGGAVLDLFLDSEEQPDPFESKNGVPNWVEPKKLDLVWPHYWKVPSSNLTHAALKNLPDIVLTANTLPSKSTQENFYLKLKFIYSEKATKFCEIFT